MSFIQNFFTSRDNNANTESYVGQTDRLWYDPDTNTLRISNGSTPGGLPIDLSINANANINTLTVNNITVNNAITSTDGNVNFTGNLVITGNIPVATDIKIGGVRAGPGANISNTGLLTIDTAGLPLSFGNFTASNNILTIVNNDENMILQTDGNAEIQLVGNIGFYKPDGIPPNEANRFAFFNSDGQSTFYVPTEDVAGAMNIIGSTTGNLILPGLTGAMLHITGQANIPSRFYHDGNGDYVAWVARRWNGNVVSPTQVLANQDVLRINATAATDAGVGNVAMAQMQFRALENQTTTAQGSAINFFVTPIGNTASNRVEVANITVADGVTATKFTTTGTLTTSAVQLNTTANVNSNTVGLLSWNSTDSTLNINHPNDVTQQVGQEFYAITENITGNPILNGTVVGYTGAMTNDVSRMTVEPYLANGSTPTLTALGITTQAIANNTSGFTTMLGQVRDIDTTGTPVSETWAQGQILYASPTVPGGLTNIKPSAPNNVVPMAVVLKVDAAEGQIFVRPSYEQQKNYGTFYSNVTQTLNNTNTAANITLNNTAFSLEIDVDSTDPSKVIFRDVGLYAINFNAQVESTNGTTKSMYFWLRRDGNDVPASSRVITTTTDNEFQIACYQSVFPVTVANTYVQFMWASTNTGVQLAAVGNTAFAPASPSVQVDIVQTAL